MSISSFRKENDCLLLNTIKKISYEYNNNIELTKENIEILNEKIYQIWIKSDINNEGFLIIDYLEKLIEEKKMNDNFFILIISTLSRNENFYYIFLNDQKRFKQLFNSLIKKPVYLMRYIELLYYYCPINIISTIGFKFYRFIVDNYLIKYFHQTSNDIDWIAEFSILIYQFYENTKKNAELIFLNSKDAIDYSIYVINTLLYHQLKIHIEKDLIYDIKLINTITKTIGIVWEQNSDKEK